MLLVVFMTQNSLAISWSLCHVVLIHIRPIFPHTHTHTYIYIYIYVCIFLFHFNYSVFYIIIDRPIFLVYSSALCYFYNSIFRRLLIFYERVSRTRPKNGPANWSFYRRVRKIEKSLYKLRHVRPSVRPSICPRGTTRLPLDGLS